MTLDNLSEFIKQNGSFGVLILLLMAFAYWGLPYFVRRQEKTQEDHDKRIDGLINKFDTRLESITNSHERALGENTRAITAVANEVKLLSERLDGVEGTVSRCPSHHGISIGTQNGARQS
jgi:hypothetical protein